MSITSLQITDFRNLASVELLPAPSGLNVISGQNGSGKTSILEAVYYLSLGRSFRSSTPVPLIRHSSNKLSLFAQLLNEGQRLISIGMERGLEGTSNVRVGEKNLPSLSELAYIVPLRLINSQSHLLFEAGPLHRRKYLDWGLFYQFDNFLPCWRKFERALKQRNALLKNGANSQTLDSWTNELIKYAIELDQLRQHYVKNLIAPVQTLTQDLLGLSVDLSYYQGWDESMTYADVLAECYWDDKRCGFTQFGPHRADLDLSIDMISVKHFLSRGQQKLLICAMIIAQGTLLEKIEKRSNAALIYLVDDLPSELDLHSKHKLLSLLSKQGSQVFITAIESEEITNFVSHELNVPMKVFHVEHGVLKAVSLS